MDAIITALSQAGLPGALLAWVIYKDQTTDKGVINALQEVKESIEKGIIENEKSNDEMLGLILNLLDEVAPKKGTNYKKKIRNDIKSRINRRK